LRSIPWRPRWLASVLVGEPITVNLILGLVAAFAGIWIAAGTKAHASLLVPAGHPADPRRT
jgi:hypothetical protein